MIQHALDGCEVNAQLAKRLKQVEAGLGSAHNDADQRHRPS
jgi:hypothetical protein